MDKKNKNKKIDEFQMDYKKIIDNVKPFMGYEDIYKVSNEVLAEMM